jgi:hypothetical protein
LLVLIDPHWTLLLLSLYAVLQASMRLVLLCSPLHAGTLPLWGLLLLLLLLLPSQTKALLAGACKSTLLMVLLVRRGCTHRGVQGVS